MNALPVLVDTSAWAEYLRATSSAHDRWLQDAVEDTQVRLAWTEPVLHELAGGARSTRHATELGSMLRAGPLLAVNALLDWADAATLRRRTRRRGRPVRSISDALIATVAVRTGTLVLARDRDFAQLAAVSDLQLLEP